MSSDIEFRETGDRPLKNPLIVVGFPTVGFVGAIAGQYLVEGLGLQLIGGIHTRQVSPVVLLSGGKILSPFRIYAGNEVCGADGECDQLIVITSELVPPPSVMWSMADGILEWAATVKAKMVVLLEGVVNSHENPTTRVWGAASTDRGAAVLKKHQVDPIEHAMIGGLSAAILAWAGPTGPDVVCLLTEAHPEIPDPRAASALISAVGRLTPRLKIDPAPLLREAEQIEAQLKQAAAKLQAQQDRRADVPTPMFA